LDYDLSRRRHFPAINWTSSFSLYNLKEWYTNQVSHDWTNLVAEAMALLQREVELLEIVQLVGPDALAESERAILAIARMLREDFLQQSAYHEVDRFCPIDKAFWMLNVILDFYHGCQAAMGLGVSQEQIFALPVLTEISRMKELEVGEAREKLRPLIDRVHASFAELGVSQDATARDTRP
jgi:V/A-type H+-transporting ATPase subunit A